MPPLDPQSLPRHTDRLFRAAWALCGSREDAEDLVQETFARVLTRPRSLRGQDELAYLMRVLRNTFLTQRRTLSRRPQISAATLEDVEPVDPRIAQRPQEATEMREVLATIAGLSEHHKLALIAVDIVGLSYREAAELLDTREETLAVRLFRARKQMTERVAGRRPTGEVQAPPSTPHEPRTSRQPARPTKRAEGEGSSTGQKASYSVVRSDGY